MSEEPAQTEATGRFEIGPAEGQVTIGDKPEQAAKVEIPITNASGEALKIQIVCTLRYGTDKEALLAKRGDHISLSLTRPDTDPVTLKPATARFPDRMLGWMTSLRPSDAVSVASGKTITIRLADFVSATPPGNAILGVGIRLLEPAGWQPGHMDDLKYHDVEIAKRQKDGSEPTIDYFRVSSDFLAGSGESVSVSFHARNFASCTLYRNNKEVQTWTDDGAHVIQEQPSITTTYRLSAKETLDGKNTTVVYRTVQVLAAGWNTLRPPQGYPTQLFVQSDLQSGIVGEAQRLYGIFRDGDRSRLFSSGDGIDDWRDEYADTPEGMLESPGIAFDNRLWLIGGSSFDDDKPGCKVYCFERASSNDPANLSRKWQRKKDLPVALAGHACCLLPGDPPRIAVIGGGDNGIYSQKVYTLAETDGDWKESADSAVHGSGLAATAVKSPGDPSWQVWVHRGRMLDPTTRLPMLGSDVWTHKIKGGASDCTWTDWHRQAAMRPHQGYPLGATLVTLPSAQEVLVEAVSPQDAAHPGPGRQRLFLLGTFLLPDPDSGPVPPDAGPLAPPPRDTASGGNVVVSRMLEWHSANRRWEMQDVNRGWETYSGTWFRMQAVSMYGFIFVWSLHTGIGRDGSAAPRLNVFVP